MSFVSLPTSTYQEPLAVAERIFIMVEEQACIHCGYDFIYDQEGCDECRLLTAFLEQHGFTVPEEGASLGDTQTLCGCWVDGEFRPGEQPCEQPPRCPTCGYDADHNGWFCGNSFHTLHHDEPPRGLSGNYYPVTT
jgi:hypothetical protein